MSNVASSRRAAAAPASALRQHVRWWLPLAFLVTTALAVFALPARAQERAFEIRPYAGAYIPTGSQRDFLKDAVVVGAQASYRVLPRLAITGNFGWSPAKDRVTPGDETVDVYKYDLGAELRGSSWVNGRAWDFSPFVGLGAGGRTYDYRDLDVDSRTNFHGYGALGGDFRFGRTGLRIEGRNYVSGFKPLTGEGESETRNDVTVAAGLTVRF